MIVVMLYLTAQQNRYEEQLAANPPEIAGTESGAEGTTDASELARPGGAGAEALGAASGTPSTDRFIPARKVPLKKTFLKNENVIAEISNDPAWISSWRLIRYNETAGGSGNPIELVSPELGAVKTEVAGVSGADFGGLRYAVLESDARQVVQRAENEAGILTRTIRLDPEGYGFSVELGFVSRRSDPVDARFEVLWPAGVSDRPDFREVSLIAYEEEEGTERTPVMSAGQPGFLGFGGGRDGVERVEGQRIWAGTDVRYFASVLIDEEHGGFDVQFESIEDKESAQTRMAAQSVSMGPGGAMARTFRGYIGPKTIEQLSTAGPGLEHTISRGYSWIEPLVRLFEIALDKLYLFTRNYGIAIIVLTMMVRALVSPLMVRQMRSAEKMRVVQPKVKALQEKYKDDRQKQSEEMMKLWKEEGINPLGGCLPLLFQFPVLIGLFFALQSSIGLRHAPFALWIQDLSQPETLFTIPGLDFPIRLLPLLMGASMFVQQKMTPTSGMDPAQAKMMLIMMPAMMLFISYTFPSGLVLYWTVSNLLGIAHQYWIRNKMQTETAG